MVNKPEYAAVQKDLAQRLLRHLTETLDPILKGAITPPQHRETLELLGVG